MICNQEVVAEPVVRDIYIEIMGESPKRCQKESTVLTDYRSFSIYINLHAIEFGLIVYVLSLSQSLSQHYNLYDID